MSGFELYLEREDGETTFIGTGTGLKPCPFCGGEARLFFAEETGFWDVQCQDCGAEPYLRMKDHEAVAAWNGRRNLVCRNFGGEEGTVGEGYDFACDLCGFCCDLPDARYCPSCGARVEGAVG